MEAQNKKPQQLQLRHYNVRVPSSIKKRKEGDAFFPLYACTPVSSYRVHSVLEEAPTVYYRQTLSPAFL